MKREEVEQVVEVLNGLLLLYRDSITKIFVTRQRCTTTLERSDLVVTRGDATISALGVLNGLMDQLTSTKYRVGVDYNPEADIINRFSLVETKEVEENDEQEAESPGAKPEL